MIRAKCAFLIALLSALPSCSSMTSKIAHDTSQEAVSTGLETSTTPQNKERLGELTDVVLSRLAAPENAQHVRALVLAASKAFKEGAVSPNSPAMQERQQAMVADSIKTGIRAASEELRRALPSLIKDLAADPMVRDAVKPLSREAGGGAVKGAADAALGGGNGR